MCFLGRLQRRADAARDPSQPGPSGLAAERESLQLRRDEAIARALSDAAGDFTRDARESPPGVERVPQQPLAATPLGEEDEAMQEAIRRSLAEQEAQEEEEEAMRRSWVEVDGGAGAGGVGLPSLGAAAALEVKVGAAVLTSLTLGEFVEAVESLATAEWPDWLPFPDIVDDENVVVSLLGSARLDCSVALVLTQGQKSSTPGWGDVRTCAGRVLRAQVAVELPYGPVPGGDCRRHACHCLGAGGCRPRATRASGGARD
jgi:hypothetical protein